jgi:hypothetical protein
MRRSHRWYGAGSAPAVVGCRRRRRPSLVLAALFVFCSYQCTPITGVSADCETHKCA